MFMEDGGWLRYELEVDVFPTREIDAWFFFKKINIFIC